MAKNYPENCMDCTAHRVIKDPDPDDSFNYDDQAIVCSLTPNPEKNMESKHPADWSNYRAISVAVRPYNLRKEADTPEWCPKKKES